MGHPSMLFSSKSILGGYVWGNKPKFNFLSFQHEVSVLTDLLGPPLSLALGHLSRMILLFHPTRDEAVFDNHKGMLCTAYLDHMQTEELLSRMSGALVKLLISHVFQRHIYYFRHL